MPIYVWRCESCEAEKEMIVNISEADLPPEACEKCGSQRWSKRMQPTRFQRGPGWGGSKGNW